jgi:hypothetical protein
MRYLLQVYFNGAQDRLAQLPDDERGAIVDDYVAFFARPEIRDGNQLQPPKTATTVRVEEGEAVVTEGPFAEAGEPLGGYYLVEADDIDAAVGLAARIPAARMGGAIEIRAVVAQ